MVAETVKSVCVEDFLPSVSGLHFANAFPHAPVIEIGRGNTRFGIGDAANGLCGGMVFAARDLFEAGLPPPPDTEPPARRTPLFRYLVRRLFGSFDLPAGPAKYMAWMVLPTGDPRLGLRGLASRSLREWPQIKRDLDRGILCPVGLVRVRSANPLELGRNHQVLAYGYEVDEASRRAALRVYDPNHPNSDEMKISFGLEPGPKWEAAYVAGELPVRGFFRTRFRPVDRSADSLRMIMRFDPGDRA